VIEKSTSQRAQEQDIVERHEGLLRETDGAREGAEMLPTWLLIGFLALAFLGAGYLFWNSGGFSVKVFNPARVAWDGAGRGAAAPPDPMVIGKRLFTQNCAVCHQQTGLGVAGQFPPLAGSEWVLSQDWHGDNHIVRIVLHGFHEPVTVKGEQFNNVMAPWGKVLKDEQIAAILTYVRNEWGNKASPITKDFVSKIREENKDRTEPWTQKELQSIGRVLVEEAAATPATSQPAAGGPAPATGVPPAPATGAPPAPATGAPPAPGAPAPAPGGPAPGTSEPSPAPAATPGA
jgi:mono/diheme cytochrome c family protein